MKRNLKSKLAVLAALIFMVVFCGTTVWAADVEIKGEVLENGKIMGDDFAEYVISDDGQGAQVIENETGKVIKATGTVSEKNGRKTITIKAYTVEGSAGGG